MAGPSAGGGGLFGIRLVGAFCLFAGMSPEFNRRVYRVGERLCGMLDLLGFFLREEFFEGGVPRVSDLHLKSGQPARLRVDGELIPVTGATALTDEIMATLLTPVLGEKRMAGLRRQPPQDVDASFDWADRSTSFRINAFVEREGLACVFRILPREIPQPKDLGFPTDLAWREIVEMNQGLVLVTGITGSGKSTTIASLLRHIGRHRAVRLITLEDPIEYIMPNERALVSQRQVGLHVGSFAEGLRSGLREDPDIIFVGEMRDRETAGLALTAAETGHLVFSTLHTKDAKGALSRIVDLFPPERFKELCSQLSFSLSWVIGQKLVNRANGRGRRPAMEILRNTPAMSNLIRNGVWQQIESSIETQAREGMITMEGSLIQLVEKGEITPEEALRHVNNPSIRSRLS